MDATFGTGGKVFTTFTAAPTTDAAAAVVLQPDGKLVVAGQGAAGLEIARYNPTGALDPTFGTDGKVTYLVAPPTGSPCFATNPGTVPVITYAMTLQADGKLVVAGSAASKASFVARFLPTGALDTGFGTNGITYVCGGTVAGYPVRVGRQPTGELLVMAHRVGINSGNYPIGAGNPAVYRLQANGTLDNSYVGDLGRSYARFTDGFVDNAGRAIAVGFQDVAESGSSTITRQLIVARRLPTGAADPAFGTAGVAELRQLDNAPVAGRSVSELPGGQFLVLGETRGATASLFLARFTATGTLDATFGTNGTVNLGLLTANDFTEMSLLADAKILLVGSVNNDFALRRLLPTGQPDLTYGLNSYLTVNEDAVDRLTDVVEQPDGNTVAVGFAAATATGQNSRFAVLRAARAPIGLATRGRTTTGELRVTPNPVSGHSLRVEVGGLASAPGPVTVELLSSLGQVIARTTAAPAGIGRRHTATLTMPTLPVGVYLLRARSAGSVAVTRVLMQ
ncbi:delta-60 repeat domain-containing protein [Hymenobacter weizhouensis]|uniref:delta-60 repeat domain-containing protein n=1 Tax=Hymenobacter sp. YIM 151500-1 TaxID=2987689 RepID=UPI002226B3AE|nr:delta-60 repeat domain-containing protein [Hymenobacter sp. YIM 151500-1]UYZ65244.1 delta-60 repeat domain-containing protein [Hymenobacter sp. YIM 151500-1]